jgi:hypothetical protein
MTRKSEQAMVKMILSLIDSQGQCVINDQILNNVFRRPDRSDNELQPLFDPVQERLQEFCARHELMMIQGKFPGRTVFRRRLTTVV